jgi:predicted MarR family transcription regulator
VTTIPPAPSSPPPARPALCVRLLDALRRRSRPAAVADLALELGTDELAVLHALRILSDAQLATRDGGRAWRAL